MSQMMGKTLGEFAKKAAAVKFASSSTSMSSRRQAIVSLAFSKMDPNGMGAIDPETLVSQFDANQHPDVLAGNKTPQAALMHFLDGFVVGGEKEGQVTANEFEQYYSKISATIDSDDYFETMIRNLYGVTAPSTSGAIESKTDDSPLGRMLTKKAPAVVVPPNDVADYDLEMARARNNSKAVLNRLAAGTESSSAAPQQRRVTNAHALSDPAHPSDHRGMSWEGSSTSDDLRQIALAGPGVAGAPAARSARLTAPISAVPAGIAFIVQKVRMQLCHQGAMGFVHLQRTFRLLVRTKKSLGMPDFKYACKELQIDMVDAELRQLYEHFSDKKTGCLDVVSFLAGVRVSLSDARTRLVLQVFAKLDVNGDGLVSAEEIATAYDPTQHPEVLAHRATANGVLAEFLETFDVGAEVEGMVTQGEFLDYYANVSAAIENDAYFELMVRNVWHVFGAGMAMEDSVGTERQVSSAAATTTTTRRVLVTRADGSQYVEEVKEMNDAHLPVSGSGSGSGSGSHKRAPLTIKERYGAQGAMTQTFSVFDVRSNAEREAERARGMRVMEPRPLIDATGCVDLPPPPAGVLVRPPEPTHDQQQRRPTAQAAQLHSGIGAGAGEPLPPTALTPPAPPISYGTQHIITKLKTGLKSLGVLGYITLERTLRLRVIDRAGSRLITLADFKHAAKSLNVGLNDVELRQLFEHFDTNDTRLVDFEELMRGVRASLSGSRLHLVRAAFARLDRDGRGVVDASLIAEMYDPSQHPDVISGRSSTDQVLSEFLSTFDVGGVMAGKVTLPEFVNYYANIGASIDNDDYFELMVGSAWGVKGAREKETPHRVLVTRGGGNQYVEEEAGGVEDDDDNVAGGWSM